jgi:hypothetical protein
MMAHTSELHGGACVFAAATGALVFSQAAAEIGAGVAAQEQPVRASLARRASRRARACSPCARVRRAAARLPRQARGCGCARVFAAGRTPPRRARAPRARSSC